MSIPKKSTSDPALAGLKPVDHRIITSDPNMRPDTRIQVNDEKPKKARVSVDSERKDSDGAWRYPHLLPKAYNQFDKETLVKSMLKERSENRKEGLRSVLPDPKPGISGWTTTGFAESEISECPAGMEAVIPEKRIFIEVAGKEFDNVFQEEIETMTKYELSAENKDRLYFVAETLNEIDSFPFKIRELDFLVTGPQGGMVFNMTGTTHLATIGNDDTTFGTIRKLGLLSNWSPSTRRTHYAVFDKDENELYRLVPYRRKGFRNVEYNIFPAGLHKRGTEIGSIKQNWIDRMHGPQEYGILFPNDLSPTSKTLLLGVMVFLHFRTQEPVFYGPNKKRFWIGLYFNIIIYIIILTLFGIIVGLALFGEKPDKPDESKLAAQLERLCKET